MVMIAGKVALLPEAGVCIAATGKVDLFLSEQLRRHRMIDAILMLS
jgi:hypothetical protein